MSAFNFDVKTTAEEAVEVLANEIQGRTVLITGASPGGLGGETARAIAKYTGLLILAGRSGDKIEEMEQIIKKENPHAKTRHLLIDQASLASVRKAAAEVNAYSEPIDTLVNNAGILPPTYKVSEDGCELQFAVNHLSHFLLTNLIKPSLLRSKDPRVVIIASAAHRRSNIRWDDIGFNNGKDYESTIAYGQSKTANLLFMKELGKRWSDVPNLSIVAVHPGRVQTNIAREASREELERQGFPSDENGKWLNSKTLSQGAATYVVGAFTPELTTQSGSFMVNNQFANDALQAYATDEEAAERLWKLSEELVGEKF